MQVKSIVECSHHSAILLAFIKLSFVIMIFVLSIFVWPLKTGFTVYLLSVLRIVMLTHFTFYRGCSSLEQLLPLLCNIKRMFKVIYMTLESKVKDKYI